MIIGKIINGIICIGSGFAFLLMGVYLIPFMPTKAQLPLALGTLCLGIYFIREAIKPFL
jgi:Na+/melibiose symporter-like transporter